MWTYNNTINSDELYHYGVPGMKWGVRKRYLNSDGSLNARGIKKYARKAYAKDSLNSNKTKKGKAFDIVTGGHKNWAKAKYSVSSKSANKAKAEQYLKDKQKTKSTPVQKKLGKAVVNRMQKNTEKRAKHDEAIKKTVANLRLRNSQQKLLIQQRMLISLAAMENMQPNAESTLFVKQPLMA